jgi:hypothetical protein
MPWFYFETHPNSESRIVSALTFAKENSTKNLFLVDSNLFFKVKQQAIDESINLYFEQFEFSSCLEIAFKNHLLFPEDPFYLFYITECTRRLMASEPFYKDALFISGVYKPEFCKNRAGLTPSCIMTEGMIKPKDKRVNNSIFNKLSGTLISLSESEYRNINNHPLVQKDTVRFLTYADAYLYFTALNRKLNYGFNNYADKKESIKFKGIMLDGNLDKKTYYTALPGLVTDFCKDTITEGKILWVLYNFDAQSRSTAGLHSYKVSINKDESYDKLFSYFENEKVKLDLPKNLHFDEYNKILHYFYMASDHLSTRIKIKRTKQKTSVDYSISEVMPELYSLLRNHDYKTVVFSSIGIQIDKVVSPLTNQTFTSESWTINNYMFDAKKNKIRCHSTKMGKSDALSMFASIKQNENIEKDYFEAILELANSSNE